MLVLWKESCDKLDSVLKSKTITLPTKVGLVKAMVYPIVMYGCESWTKKKAEHKRIDAFELGCWRRLLRVSWTAAAAKSLQLCLTLRPLRRQPTRLLRPWDSPGKNTGVGCHFLLQCVKVKSESEVAQSCPDS